MKVSIFRVGDFTLQWGESLVWDERGSRLYFVDCASSQLHWLEGGDPPLNSLALPSMPTGLVLTEDDALLLAALDDGLHLVDVNRGTTDLIARYPAGLGGRANDASADLDGNLVTGSLSLIPSKAGSYWWYSARAGWHQLDDGIGSANGPVVIDNNGETTLIVADSHADVLFAYEYDGGIGTVGERRVFADVSGVGSLPDGACADRAGGVWSCVFTAGKIARYTTRGLDAVVEAGVELPSDVAFGGTGLDRMYFVSVGFSMAGVDVTSEDAGALMVVEDTGFRGRSEPRFRL